MKKQITILAAMLVCLSAFSQIPRYTLQDVVLGTTSIAANTLLTLPHQSTTYTTSGPVALVTYAATNTLVSSNYFTRPTTNWLNVTNRFISSSNVIGTNTLTWYESKRITNSAAVYYVTNAAYVSWTNIGGTNWALLHTNAAVIHTNQQIANYSTMVPFTIVGTDTNSSYATNVVAYQNVIDVSRSASAQILVSFAAASATTNTSNPVTFTIAKSLDNSTYGPSETFSLGASGTSIVSTNIAYSVGGYGFVKFLSITNGNATNLTSLSIKYAQKVQAP